MDIAMNPIKAWRKQFPYLTLFGGSVMIIGAEILVNVVLWIVTCLLFIPDPSKRRLMSLALVAWTLGVRHGLDVDHISAIDNATRHLVALGKLPLAVGTFFSLGHSTIVIIATLAISISTSVADHLDGISSVGGIIGVSVSAGFLFLVALINSFILWKVMRQRSKMRRQQQDLTSLASSEEVNADTSKTHVSNDGYLDGHFFCGRIAKPLFKMIDSSWKMYPVGVLFGLGFDTSSEIALLAVSALAKNSVDGKSIPHSEILVLPCLFTGGMSLVDALDSIFMLWCYAVPKLDSNASRWALFEWAKEPVETSVINDHDEEYIGSSNGGNDIVEQAQQQIDVVPMTNHVASSSQSDLIPTSETMQHLQAVKVQAMSSLSIILTIISIAVALLISIVEFMGLAAQVCSKCANDAENDPGLSGRWWRFWIAVNDQSGYLGAGVVGVMIVTVAIWFACHRWLERPSM